MKKTIVAVISYIILIIIMSMLVVTFGNRNDQTAKTDKKLIVATLFPEYDFAKQIVKDKMDVKLLVKSGVETHNYEPTAKDMIMILDKCDVFLYTGDKLEPWTSNIVKNLEENSKKAVNTAENVELIKIEDFEEKHINKQIVYDSEEHESEEIYDEHIWLSMDNALKMIDTILKEIVTIDPTNKEFYEKNAKEYKAEIVELKENYSNLIANSNKKEIAIGGEFAYAYLVEELGLRFVSVYDNCGEGEDPSLARIKSVIDYINENNMQVIYYEELSEGTVAKMISEETNAEPLVLYSIHNADVEKDTYVSLMKENYKNLEKGLR